MEPLFPRFNTIGGMLILACMIVILNVGTPLFKFLDPPLPGQATVVSGVASTSTAPTAATCIILCRV